MKLFNRIKSFFYDASEFSRDRSMRAVYGDRARQGSEDDLVSQNDRDILIRQCRDVYRNNPIARGIIKRMCDMVVGQGITPQPTTRDETWNKLAFSFWRDWCSHPEPTEMLSFVDILSLATSAVMIEGGSALLLHRDGSVELLELERFRPDPTDKENQRCYRMDAQGRITHWCLHDRDAQGYFSDKKGSYSWVKAENILTMFPRDRADQIMPIPQLASCMAELRDVQELNRYTLRQAKVQSLPSVVHKKGADNAKANFGGSRFTKADNSEAVLRDFAEANGINILETTGDINTIAPATPSSTYETFVKLNLKLIAMAVGIPLDVLMLWFSDGTYSSSKATLTQAHEAILKRQQMLIRCLIAPLFSWRIRKAIIMGELPEAPTDEYGLPEIPIDWRLPAYEWMDAGDSLQSSLLSIRAGLSTLREECEKRGHNLEDLLRAKIGDLQLMKRLADEAGVAVTDLSDVVVLGAPKTEV